MEGQGVGTTPRVAYMCIFFVEIKNSLFCCCKILMNRIRERSLVLALPTMIYLPISLGPLLPLITLW